MKTFRFIVKSLGDVFFPATCPVCGRHMVDGERDVCMACQVDMPRVAISDGRCEEVERLLIGCRVIERAVSMFHYHRSSPYAGILKDIKYHNEPGLGKSLARVFAEELAETGFFTGVDTIVPIPLHKSKLNKRGYNQSLYIADGLSAVTGIAVSEAVTAVRPHVSQTLNSAEERRLNVDDIFEADETLAGKVVLLVDDVITTGSTIMSCCDAMRRAGVSSVRVLSLAFAGSF